MRTHQVRCLLMGGQACVLYGGAEFSRDTDLAILADPENERRIRLALRDLQADVIAVPPFLSCHLEAGHAVHFRCRHPEASGMRVDVMARMRGVADFPTLWDRRTTLEMDDGTHCEVLSLPDLIQAKKTQRDKDWPMIRRLVEASYFANYSLPTEEQLVFWFRELRTTELLCDLARSHPLAASAAVASRALIVHAIAGDCAALKSALEAEERQERLADQAYWKPLKQELERLAGPPLRTAMPGRAASRARAPEFHPPLITPRFPPPEKPGLPDRPNYSRVESSTFYSHEQHHRKNRKRTVQEGRSCLPRGRHRESSYARHRRRQGARAGL